MSLVRREANTVLDARDWSGNGELWAIVDACDTPSVVQKVTQLGDQRAVSLYRGGAEEQFESIAPYLMAVDTSVFDWITQELWSEPWGILVRSRSDLKSLRTHFRRFLIVKSPKGEDWYFRFYDPRILTTFLPSCSSAQLADFYGPVKSFAVTDSSDYSVTSLTRLG